MIPSLLQGRLFGLGRGQVDTEVRKFVLWDLQRDPPPLMQSASVRYRAQYLYSIPAETTNQLWTQYQIERSDT